ncbi:Asp-tRNA(Asn)/Glu-tRNA(Gln) amidotransferase subunit GatB [Candidatus Parcubacteria bacterium]|nr:Asp-tRNA(Asn)/Glu-tRNA(Gln) amidotransferase subunit GatB [Candidatus Parcubacteria bacterium]
MAPYRPTIGLEVHAELKTQTKMFCNSKNDPDEERPNANVCPVCMAHPGTLPVINKEAVRHILRIGTAVGGKLADFSEFDRKSYFYPDIPKGYQISQYIHPLVAGGSLADVEITRVHLEEDTARSTHVKGKSLVDFNRAGIPLMELVTEPVIHDAETAGKFARELQLLLRTLGAGEANLEKGEMRIEANISVSNDETKFGTKVEVKNLNSFRSVERAIAFEIQRQTALIEGGGKVVQETRGWDESKQETFHQRFKEGSADYRYFPEPDLPKLFLSEIPEFSSEAIHASLPELPWERRVRYEQAGIKTEAVEILMQNIFLRSLFDGIAKKDPDDAEVLRLSANYITSDLMSFLNDAGAHGKIQNFTEQGFLQVMKMIQEGKLSSRGAKDVLAEMYASGGEPEDIASMKGLIQIHDSAALSATVDAVLAKEEKAVQEYKSGKQAALQYLIGKSMRESHGAGNPESIRKLITEKLG